MTLRESIIAKLLSAVIMSGFVLYILPNFTASFFSLVVIFLATTVISISVAKALTDKDAGILALMPAILAFVATLLLFTVSPVKLP